MDEDRLVLGIFYIVKMVAWLGIYGVIATFLLKVPFLDVLLTLGALIVVGIVLYIVDYLLQSMLEVDILVRVIYGCIIAFLVVFGYGFVTSSYAVLLGDKLGIYWQLLIGVQIYCVLYWVHLSIKRFSEVFLNLEII